ncbi:MAG: ChaN family lipoprotein [Nitrospiraceae bacterium]|nr:ChaN family lipoprotein [Nitrospiraceae bacterium]
MKKIIFFAILLLVSCPMVLPVSCQADQIVSCQADQNGPAKIRTMRVLRVRDKRVIGFREMVREIKSADVILLGEVHSSAADHRAQLAVIRALRAAKAPFAIGLEMFRADSQKALDRWVSGQSSLRSFQDIYYKNWSAPWPLYRDIFLYARQRRIPMVGLNVPKDISDTVFARGFNSLTPAEKKEVPPGISCTVDKKYQRFINEAYQFHRVMGGGSFYDFCQAQMLWDSVMAWHIVDHLESAPGVKMVVLTGVGHAWKRGIPARIGRRSDYRVSVVLPEMPTGKSDRDITTGDADYILQGLR